MSLEYQNLVQMTLLHILLAGVIVDVIVAQPSSDPTLMNGGSVLAMTGRNCVALAVDKQFGSRGALVNIRTRPLLMPSPTCLVGFTGLESDVQSLRHELATLITSKLSRGLGFTIPALSLDDDGGGHKRLDDNYSAKSNINYNREDPVVTPRSMASLLSHVLYGRKRAPYYVEPVVVGLQRCFHNSIVTQCDPTATLDSSTSPSSTFFYRPFLYSFDTIGAKSTSTTFVCAGAASSSLYGTAEALWEPNLSPSDLVRVCGEAFLAALERDCLSGYGAIVYLLMPDDQSHGEKTMVVEYELAARND
jgi:20S proteasome subunit beta 3